MDLLERLADKFTVGDGCWEWTASLNTYGYGQLWTGETMRGAHRVMYELMIGPIPEGLHLDHLCRNRACIRPDHLEPVTPGENVRRGVGVGATSGGANRAKTHCPHGHLYDEANTRWSTRRRHCRACDNERSRARRSH